MYDDGPVQLDSGPGGPMASIDKRGPKQWRARVRRAGQTVTKTFESKGEAEAWAQEVEAGLRRGISYAGLREAEQTTLSEALERYLGEVTPRKKGAVQERNRIRRWQGEDLARKTLTELRSVDFAQWRDKRLAAGKAASTVRNDLNLISAVFEHARKEWGYEALTNPLRLVGRPRLPSGRDRRLAEGEEARLLAAARASRSPWIAPAIIIAVEVGMRQGEILALRWDDISISDRVATVRDSKNGEMRIVPLSPRVLDMLREMPRSVDGRVIPITQNTIEDLWRRVRHKAGIDDLRFHDLRHEATSRLFEDGFETMEVSSITGHKTLSMLRRYTHMRAKKLAQKLAERRGGMKKKPRRQAGQGVS